MDLIGFVLLKLVKYFINIFKPKEEMVLPTLKALGTLANIFAWANAIIPVDTILLLMAISASFYVFKMLMNMVRFIIGMIKK